MREDAVLRDVVAAQPHPLLFATVSGAHLYGFPSADSDVDLRGVHVLPPEHVMGLDTGPETIESMGVVDGREIDLVTHDARKFFDLLLRRNGYVLEQLLSPLVVLTTPEHAELKRIARRCVTRNHAHHYLGFARSQWRLVEKDDPPRVKPLLYVYRVLLTGIHLMRTGEIEANLSRLVEAHGPDDVTDLIARKTAGAEHGRLESGDLARHRAEIDRLVHDLETARDESTLPEHPTARPELHDLLLRIREDPPVPDLS